VGSLLSLFRGATQVHGAQEEVPKHPAVWMFFDRLGSLFARLATHRLNLLELAGIAA
jgi:hypothetical protein